MIQIQITVNTPQKAKQLATELLNEHLILDAKISRVEKIGAKGRVFKKSIVQYMLFGRTKALLFPLIQKFVKQRNTKGSLDLYSVPIVHMDEHQADILRRNLKKV